MHYRRRRIDSQVPGIEARYSWRGGGSMSERVPIVYIVDDDEVTRSYFDAVLSTANVRCCRVESASSFLEMYDPDQPGCLLLDVQMPGMTGPELQHELNLRGAIIPVIFIDRKSTRLNSSHLVISYAVFCLKKKKRADCILRPG